MKPKKIIWTEREEYGIIGSIGELILFVIEGDDDFLTEEDS
jgi:hypothetical protein